MGRFGNLFIASSTGGRFSNLFEKEKPEQDLSIKPKIEEPADLFTGEPKLSALTSEAEARSLSAIDPEAYQERLKSIRLQKAVSDIKKQPWDYTGGATPVEAFMHGFIPTPPEARRPGLAEAHPGYTTAGKMAGLITAARMFGGIEPAVRTIPSVVKLGIKHPYVARVLGKAAGTATQFGTKELVDQLLKTSYGEQTPMGAAEEVAKETAFGAGLAAPTSIARPLLRIPATGAYGFAAAKMAGAETPQALLQGAMFVGLEAFNRSNLTIQEKKVLYRQHRENIINKIKEKQNLSFEEGLANNRAMLKQFGKPEQLQAEIKRLMDEGRIVRVPDEEIPALARQIRNQWSKSAAAARTGKVKINLLTPEELLGAREPGYFTQGKKPTLQPETPRPTFTGQPVAQGKQITFAGQPSPLLAEGEKAAYEAALAAKEPFQPRGAELAEAFEMPLHPAPKRIEEPTQPTFAGQPVTLPAYEPVDYAKPQIVEHKGQKITITPEKIKEYARMLFAEEQEKRGWSEGADLLGNILAGGKINVKFFKNKAEVKAIPQFVKLKIFTTDPNGRDLDEAAQSVGLTDTELITKLQEYKPKAKPKSLEEFYPQALEELTQYKKQQITAPKAGGQVFTGQPYLKEGETIAGGKVVQTFKPADIKDVSGRKLKFGSNDTIFTYPIAKEGIFTGKIYVKDGDEGIVSVPKDLSIKEAQKVIQERITGEKVREVSPEEAQIEEVVSAGKPGYIIDEIEEGLYQVRDEKTENFVNSGSLAEMQAWVAKQKRGQGPKFGGPDTTLPGGENYREVGILAKDMPKGQEFISSHFPDWENLIAHIRMNDRTTPDGKKVLFIEEIQSDWSNEGRAKGFRVSMTQEQMAEVNKLLKEREQLSIETSNPRMYGLTFQQEQQALHRMEYIDRIVKKYNVYGKPPFHPLLKNWQELALKKVIKEAVEGGYDYLSWTTGEQQAERYGLSKVVDWIEYDKHKNGIYRLHIKTKTEGLRSVEVLNEEEMAKWIPKEIAHKIITSGKSYDKLENLDLKIGGEWAKNLYDRQIPNILKDLTKGEIKNIRIKKLVDRTKQLKLKQGDKVEEVIDLTQPALAITPEIRIRVIGQPIAGGKIHKQETQIGRGTVLNTKAETDRSEMQKINQGTPFTLLGNKAEVISRMSKELKAELTKEIDKVYDLFGGAKGYRAGLFPNLPSENYHLNEFSDERYNYYKNLQSPEALVIMKQNIQQYRNQMIDRIAEGFEIPKDKYSPEVLRKNLNVWLTRGTNEERRQFARSIIQEYGNSLLEQAVADKWQSPTSSAIYYFLQNTSVFGIKQTSTGWQWSQGIIRTSGDKTEISDAIRRIEDSDKQLDAEAKRDAQMLLTQKDAWQVMDEVAKKLTTGELDPQKTVVLVDPQYLNPTEKQGTYTVGQQDSFWKGHKRNLEKHLLPLAQTGVKVIYTNNEDINLTRWLRANKLPYNVEESIGATALRGGRDEIISIINYKLPKEYTARLGVGAIGEYVPEEITGESKQFEEWLVERKRLEREGKIKPPSFGVGWTPQERKDLYVQALNKGLIYKDIYGKEHDKLHGLIKHYSDASFTQLKAYISELTGDRENPPKVFKMFGDITRDTEIMKMLNKVADKWQDINKMEVGSLDPARIVEKVTGQDLWDDNILADNTFFTIAAGDEAMFDRLTRELTDLKSNKQGVMKTSKESAEIMRKFETKEPLTDKEQKVVNYLRQKYDALIAEANEMRMRMKKPPIPYRQDYMTHILEQNLLNDFFKGDMDAIKNISSAQLDAIRKGDYTKGNMPFNRFALKRLGKKTRYDAIGNYEAYLKVILKEIYYTPALTHARKFTEYALRKQPNAWKAMDRLFNDLKGKPSIVDQNLVGAIASSKPIKWIRGRIAKNALIGNINFWAINASNFTVSYDELGNYMNKGMAKFLGTRKWRQFAFKNSLMLKNRTIDPDIDPSTFKTIEEATGYITNLLEYNNVGSTFIGAYHKGIDLGYDKAKAIRYADAIARRTQVGYKKYELNAWMRSNSGMLLSQFQSWAFNTINHLIYDLKLGNIPDNLKAVFTKQGKKPVRWGAFFMLLVTSIIVDALYKKAGLRQPYKPESAVPAIAGLSPSRYSDIGPVRIAKDIGTVFTGKKPETKTRAAMRAAGPLLLPFGGTQIGRFAAGTVFPKQKEEKEAAVFSGQPVSKRLAPRKIRREFKPREFQRIF